MARGFGMTALRAALGGIAGYGQDAAARREAERMRLQAEQALSQQREQNMFNRGLALENLELRRRELDSKMGGSAPSRRQWSEKYGGVVDIDTGAFTVPTGLPKLAPPVRSTSGGSGDRARAARDLQQEQTGMAYLSANARNPALANALQAVFAANPELAERPGLAAYRVMQSRAVPTMRQMQADSARTTGSSRRSGGRAPASAPPGVTRPAAAPRESTVVDPLDAAYDAATRKPGGR